MDTRNLILTCLFFAWTMSSSHAQPTYIPTQVDSIALTIPDSLCRSVDGMAGFIAKQFPSNLDKARAIYTWVIHHISYDSTLAVPYSDEQQEKLPQETLDTHSGVCIHYAHLFAALANKVGIPAHVVTGYTSEANLLQSDMGHGWVCARIDSTWTLHDPTWGAGFTYQGTFYPRPDYTHFNVDPAEFIKRRMPYDPLWQLLYHPLTYAEFDRQAPAGERPFFNYPDSIAAFERQNDFERLRASLRRMEQSEATNDLIRTQLDDCQLRLNTHYYSQAVSRFNEAIDHLNAFINYRNNKFKPAREEAEIQAELALTHELLEASAQQLQHIKRPLQDLRREMFKLDQQIKEASATLKEHQDFTDKYFSTPRLFRSSLFYKYTWMGIPLN